MFDNAKHLVQGAAKYAGAKLFLSSTEGSNARTATCNACELLGSQRECTICHCFVDQKAKYESEHCPLASVEGVVGALGASKVTLVLRNKWNQRLRIAVAADFARIGDVIAMPRARSIINLRTTEHTQLETEPEILS